jgi:hypothetical protein
MISNSNSPLVLRQGIFVLDPRKLCIEIEIDSWQLSDFDSDSGDFDFDDRWPHPGGPLGYAAVPL